jgi:general secretion pathway protein L
VRTACLPFLRDVQNMLKFLELRGEIDATPEAIILTGGGALSAPLREEMEKFFSLPVRLADLSGLGDLTFDDEAKASWDPALMNQALALATGEMRKEPGFNFGRGEFEPRGKVEQWKKDVMLIAASALIILLLAGFDFFLGYYYDRAHLKEVKGRINAVFAEVAPEVTKIVDPVGQLRAIIDESKKTGSGGSLLASGMTMIDILKDISRLVPAEMDFVISSFTFDGGFIEIRGETDNFNTVDAIKINLEKSPFFRSVTISSANLMKGENRVGFDLKIEIKRK